MNLRRLLQAKKLTPEEALAIVPRICGTGQESRVHLPAHYRYLIVSSWSSTRRTESRSWTSLFNNWNCPLKCLPTNLTDVLVTQCLFAGNPDTLDIYCSVNRKSGQFDNSARQSFRNQRFWDRP